MYFSEADARDQIDALIAQHVMGWSWYAPNRSMAGKLLLAPYTTSGFEGEAEYIEISDLQGRSKSTYVKISDPQNKIELGRYWNSNVPKFSSNLSIAWTAVKKIQSMQGITSTLGMYLKNRIPFLIQSSEEAAALLICKLILKALQISHKEVMFSDIEVLSPLPEQALVAKEPTK